MKGLANGAMDSDIYGFDCSDGKIHRSLICLFLFSYIAQEGRRPSKSQDLQIKLPPGDLSPNSILISKRGTVVTVGLWILPTPAVGSTMAYAGLCQLTARPSRFLRCRQWLSSSSVFSVTWLPVLSDACRRDLGIAPVLSGRVGNLTWKSETTFKSRASARLNNGGTTRKQ